MVVSGRHMVTSLLLFTASRCFSYFCRFPLGCTDFCFLILILEPDSKQVGRFLRGETMLKCLGFFSWYFSWSWVDVLPPSLFFSGLELTVYSRLA